MDQPFTAEYISGLLGGQEEVERHFYGYFGPLLVNKIRRDSRNRELAEDAAQETFLRVLRNLRKNPDLLDNPAKLGAYVLGVCNLVVLELSRSSQRYQGMDGAEDNRPDPRNNQAEEMLSSHRRQAVRFVLESLSDKDRLLLYSLYFEEKDKDQICSEMKIDRGYLRVLVHRAIQRCRIALAGEAG